MVAISTTGHPPDPQLLLAGDEDGGNPNTVFVGLAVFLIVLAVLSVSTLVREVFRDHKVRRRYTELVDVERRASAASMHSMTEQALHAHQLAARLAALQAKTRTDAAVSRASRLVVELDDEVDRDVYTLCSRLKDGAISHDELSRHLGAHRASIHDQLGDILRHLDALRGSKAESDEE